MRVKAQPDRPAYDAQELRTSLDALASPRSDAPSTDHRADHAPDRRGAAPTETEASRVVFDFLARYPRLRKASAADLVRAAQAAIPVHASALRALIEQPIDESTTEMLRATRIQLKALSRALEVVKEAPFAKSFPAAQLRALDERIALRLREIDRVRKLPIERFEDARKERERGFLALQGHTSWGHDLDEPAAVYEARWQQMKPNTSIGVVHDKGKAISAAAIFLEPRFGSGLLGHLENVVTHSAFRRMGLAKRVVDEMTAEARAKGCYAIMLSCLPENASLYARCGFRPAGTQVEYNFPDTPLEAHKISPIELNGRPHDLRMRPIEPNDMNAQYASLLRQGWLALARDSEVSSALTSALKTKQKETYVLEDEVTHEIIATGSVFFEHKLQEGSGRPTAHVSDVIVDERYRGRGLGSAMLDHLKVVAQQHGAFRIMIQCSLALRPFFHANACKDTERQMMLPIDPEFERMLRDREAELAPLA
jgi:glucosamine-phosphate N-acetyltransferase